MKPSRTMKKTATGTTAKNNNSEASLKDKSFKLQIFVYRPRLNCHNICGSPERNEDKL